MKQKISATLEPELVEWLDEQALKNGRTRSSEIAHQLRQTKRALERANKEKEE